MTIGFDFGSQNCVAAITSKNVGGVSGGNFIDITLDESSKRCVPPIVGFPKKERTFGAVASKQFKSNITKTIRNPQRLLGKTFEECVNEGKWAGTESVRLIEGYQTTGGRTTPVFEINYQGEDIHVTPEHAVAMMLKHQLKHCRESDIQSNECCVTIPNNCTYTKREAMMTAARLADLNPLKLSTSTECLALDYGLLGGKARGPEMATLFMDFGHCGTDVGVVRFFDGGWDIVAQDTFVEFSGEVLDAAMIKFFAAGFEKQFGSNLLGNAKAVNKISQRLGKLKKNLVANEVASNTIDFLYDGEDFTCRISREEMWGLCQESVEAFITFLKQFLGAAKERLGDVKFEAIECVGGVSRMVDLRTRLSEVCKEEIGNGNLQFQLNTDEGVARGCVLQCAILSPRFAIQERSVRNTVPYSVLVGRQPLGYDVEEWKSCNYETLFPVWSELGKTKSITFKKPRSLRIILVVESTTGERNLVGFVDINAEGCVLKDGEKWKKFQVIVDLDNSGLLSFRVELTKSRLELVDVAKEIEVQKTEEEYAAEVEKAQADALAKVEAAREKAIAEYKKKLEERKAKAEAAIAEAEVEKNKEDGDGDIVMKEEVAEKELVNPEETELVVPEVKVNKMKKETTTEKVEKTQVIKEDIPCCFTTIMGMLPSTEESIRKLEAKQLAYDNEQVAIQKARNDLESYVLDAQCEYAEGGKYFEYMTESEYDVFINKIFEMEEYVSDDNFDKPIAEYEAQLATLTIFGDVYRNRYVEFEKRPTALNMCKKLLTQIEMFITEAPNAPDYEHIGEEILSGLANSCRDANMWLDERQQSHDRTAKTQNPPYLASEISSKISEMNGQYQKVKQTPKPKPPPKEKEEKENKSEEKPETTTTTTEEKPDGDGDVEMNPEPEAAESAKKTENAEDVNMGEN